MCKQILASAFLMMDHDVDNGSHKKQTNRAEAVGKKRKK